MPSTPWFAPRTFFARAGSIQRVSPPPWAVLAVRDDLARRVSAEDFAKYLAGPEGDEIWELWIAAAKTSYVVGQCIATTEPAYLAKHAFQLAQLFNTFYHRFPILSESDEGRKKFLLTTAAVVRRELAACPRNHGNHGTFRHVRELSTPDNSGLISAHLC